MVKAVAAAAFAVVLASPVAHAYSPSDPESQRCAATANSQGGGTTTFQQGQAIRISGGAGCAKAGQQVPIYIASTPILLGSPTADAAGNYVLQATIPSNIAPGTHTIIVDVERNGPTTGNNYQMTVQVLAAGTTQLPRRIPDTGAETGRMGALGFSILALGLALTASVGRRVIKTSI